MEKPLSTVSGVNFADEIWIVKPARELKSMSICVGIEGSGELPNVDKSQPCCSIHQIRREQSGKLIPSDVNAFDWSSWGGH